MLICCNVGPYYFNLLSTVVFIIYLPFILVGSRTRIHIYLPFISLLKKPLLLIYYPLYSFDTSQFTRSFVLVTVTLLFPFTFGLFYLLLIGWLSLFLGLGGSAWIELDWIRAHSHPSK